MKILKTIILFLLFILQSKINKAQPNDSTNNVFEQLVLNKHWVLDTFNYDGVDTILYQEDTVLWNHGDMEFKLVHGNHYSRFFYYDTLIVFDSINSDVGWGFDSTGTKLHGLMGVYGVDTLSPLDIGFTLIGPQNENDVLLLTTDKLWLSQVDFNNKTIIAKFRRK